MMVNIDSWLNGKYYCWQLKWFVRPLQGRWELSFWRKANGRQNWFIMSPCSPFQLWYWPLIGPWWSCELDTGLWLVHFNCDIRCKQDLGPSGTVEDDSVSLPPIFPSGHLNSNELFPADDTLCRRERCHKSFHGHRPRLALSGMPVLHIVLTAEAGRGPKLCKITDS